MLICMCVTAYMYVHIFIYAYLHIHIDVLLHKLWWFSIWVRTESLYVYIKSWYQKSTQSIFLTVDGTLKSLKINALRYIFTLGATGEDDSTFSV